MINSNGLVRRNKSFRHLLMFKNIVPAPGDGLAEGVVAQRGLGLGLLLTGNIYFRLSGFPATRPCYPLPPPATPCYPLPPWGQKKVAVVERWPLWEGTRLTRLFFHGTGNMFTVVVFRIQAFDKCCL